MQASEPDRKKNVLGAWVATVARFLYKKQIVSRGKRPSSILQVPDRMPPILPGNPRHCIRGQGKKVK